jgi:hypothetical protein
MSDIDRFLGYYTFHFSLSRQIASASPHRIVDKQFVNLLFARSSSRDGLAPSVECVYPGTKLVEE